MHPIAILALQIAVGIYLIIFAKKLDIRWITRDEAIKLIRR